MTAKPQMPDVGPLGRNLIANADRIRQEQRLSWRQVSARLKEAGRPIPPLGLSRMMKAGRRTDVDELIALAEVLGVDPAELLADPGTPKQGGDHPALRAARDLTSRIGDLLTDSNAGLEDLRGYVDRALRRVQVEVEEILAERRTQ